MQPEDSGLFGDKILGLPDICRLFAHYPDIDSAKSTKPGLAQRDSLRCPKSDRLLNHMAAQTNRIAIVKEHRNPVII